MVCTISGTTLFSFRRELTISRGKGRTGLHESHRCRYRQNFIFHDRRELLWHVFVLSSILQCYNFSIVTRTNDILLKYINTLRLEWRRPVVVYFTSLSRPGFSPFGDGVYTPSAPWPIFLTYAFPRLTTSSKLYGVPNHDDDYHIYRRSAITGFTSTWAVSSKYSAVRC